MISDINTETLLASYQTVAPVYLFLTSLFRTPPENFYTTKEVTIEVMRNGADVSVVIEDMATGARQNSYNNYTNKKFEAPTHDEEAPLDSFDLLQKEFGVNPFESSDFQANASSRALRSVSNMDAKIRRAIELQASQILQTGKLSLKDKNGNILYKLDYKPKSTHFVTATTAWSNTSADPVKDLIKLMDVILQDGNLMPDQLIFGGDAFNAFVQNEKVQKLFEVRNFNFGTIAPQPIDGKGGKYQGVITLGSYKVDVWTYPAAYIDVQTGNYVKFVDSGKVIVRSSMGRMDATYGAIPYFVDPNKMALPYISGRLNTGVSDLYINSYVKDNGKALVVGVASRPLLVPTAIDTFGCLNTGV